MIVSVIYIFHNAFRSLHKVSITRSHFLAIFDTAWKKTIALPQNVISGFRSCGLVPINPDNVHYRKLIDTGAARRHDEHMQQSRSNSASDAHQKLGKIMMFQVIERSLPADLRLDFESRYSEG